VLSKCFDNHHWTGVEIVEIDATSGNVLSTQRLPLADFRAPHSAFPVGEIVYLSGVVERRVIVRFEDNNAPFWAYFSVEVDSGVVSPTPFLNPPTTVVSTGGATILPRFVGLIGNVAIAFGARDFGQRGVGVLGGTHQIVQTIDTYDLVSGATSTKSVTDGTGPGESLTSSSSDALWFSGAHTSDIVRVDADGSTHHLDRFNGSIYPSGVIAAPGSLWVAIESATAGLEPRLVRIDGDDGHALSPAVPLPAGSEKAELFTTLHASSRGLLITDPSSGWWWIDNAGNTSRLAVPDGAFVSVIDDQVLVVDPVGKVVVHAILELASSS